MQKFIKANRHIDSLVEGVISQLQNKKAKLGLKILNKQVDMSFMFAIPTLLSDAINRYDLCAPGKTEFNILVHGSLKFDCVDNYRWLALIPFLINRPDLKVNVVATSSVEPDDTQTKYRQVIDFIIHNELSERFSSELIEGDISDVLESSACPDFDLILNNMPSTSDLSRVSDADHIGALVNSGIPIIVSDISPITLLHRYNMYRTVGFSSSYLPQVNINGLSFTKSMSTQYQYAGHYLLINGFTYPNEKDIDLVSSLALLEPVIVNRMNEGDPLTELPTIDGSSITLFDGVDIELTNNVVQLHQGGVSYKLKLDKIPPPPIIYDVGDLDTITDSVYWAINTYALILNALKHEKKASA